MLGWFKKKNKAISTVTSSHEDPATEPADHQETIADEPLATGSQDASDTKENPDTPNGEPEEKQQ